MRNKESSEKRRKRYFLFAGVVILALILLGGYFSLFDGGGSSGEGDGEGEESDFSSPASTVQAYYNAFNERDADKLRSCCSDKLREVTFTESITENVLDTAEYNNLQKTVEEITEVNVSGDTATVEFELEKTSSTPGWGGEENMRIYLVKEDGGWKVDTIAQVKD